MGKFTIGRCNQCGNQSELKIYPNDNPQAICENCHRDNLKLEGKILEKKAVVNVVEVSSNNHQVSDERSRYINIIVSKASDQWLDSFIKEVVVKKVLIYDWKTIIQNERWFSILDLRRFALDIDPDMDKPGFNMIENNEQIVSVIKPRKRRATKEPVNA